MATPRTVALGIAIIATCTSSVVLFLPAITAPIHGSATYRPRTPLENAGRSLYVANGCIGCHSQYIRPSDWTYTHMRVSQAGDYIEDSPHLLGSERTGPDLAQEGGMHSDDWHVAHFTDPRYTRPVSIMPDFAFLNDQQMTELIAFIQSLGDKLADQRMARQRYWKQKLIAAYAKGEDDNVQYLNAHVPPQWRDMPNPYPPTPEELARGEFVYQQECIYCHGEVGDGNGPAARYLHPKPFNFTLLKRQPWSGGLLYYQIMNGITGSAMPFFKDDLESAKIWAVSNYIAVEFIGEHIDSNAADSGIDAALEPARKPGLTMPPYEGPIPLPTGVTIQKLYQCCPRTQPKEPKTPCCG
ncbi:MAG: c-type cytochrome [Acidobacteria bacterium]|nr:MAG: c-type cytochrome [Acidobacteriota bacterium]